MADPMSPADLLSAVQDSGLPIAELAGWRDRCRCHDGSHERGEQPNGRAWGPINGVTIHHTGGPMLTGQAAIDYCGYLIRGDAARALPGPLCQFSIDGDGRVLVIAAGRSNHVGSISQAGLDHMLAASFSLDGYQDIRGHGVDGNTHTYGIEIQNPGQPTSQQRWAAVRLAAAICRHYGWTGQEVHGHGEVADSRSYEDPGEDMGAFRRDVMSVAASTPTPAPGGIVAGTTAPPPPPVFTDAPAPTTTPATQEDDDMKAFMKVKDNDAVYVSDGLEAWHVPDVATLLDYVTLVNEGLYVIKQAKAGSPGAVNVNGVWVREVGRPALLGQVVSAPQIPTITVTVDDAAISRIAQATRAAIVKEA
jgi:hypothetical protein